MKNLILFFTLALFSFPAFSQEGVNFEHITFDEALAKAKAENKLVLMDCYTSWCGPCKMMTNTVFPQKKAGDFFNPKFVCIKYDMEKGEGIELAKRFNVKAFPTFFIIRPDGSVQHKLVGGGKLDDFIPWIEMGLDEKTSFGYLNAKYEKGKMSKKELVTYKSALQFAGERDKLKIVEKELADKMTNKDKLKADFWPVMSENRYGSDNFNFILANLPIIRKNIGEEAISEYLYNNYKQAIDANVSKYKIKETPEAKSNIGKLKKELSEINFSRKEELLEKIKFVETCTYQDKDQIISFIEQNALTAKEDIQYNMLSVLYSFRDNSSKAQAQRMVTILDQIIAKASSEKIKSYTQGLYGGFKAAAYVGTIFHDIPLDKAIEKAKKEGKMVFMDCYTSWCGPCKMMLKSIFPQEKVGDYFNKKFICVKYDLEKGDGPELVKKYGICYYPTFVIINPDGSMRHKIMGGSRSGSEFIERVNETFDDSKALGVMEKQYNKGDRDKAFLIRYTEALNTAADPQLAVIADDLMKALSDEEKLSPDYWYIFQVVNRSPWGSIADQFLRENRAKFNKVQGEEGVNRRLYFGYEFICTQIFAGREKNRDLKTWQEIERQIKPLKLAHEKTLLSYVNLAKSMAANNIDQVLATCEKEFVKLSKGKIPKNIFKLYEPQATDAQKARWEKLMQKMPQ